MANNSLKAAQKAYKKHSASKVQNGIVKKKKKREDEPKVVSKAPPKAQQRKAQPQQTNKPSFQQKQKPLSSATNTNKSERYSQFKRTAPKITNTSKTSTSNKDSALVQAQKAYQKGKNRTYLGTEQKETTTKLASDKKQKQLYKQGVKDAKKATYTSKEWKNTKQELKKQNRQGWKDYLTKDLGWSEDKAKAWMQSDEGKKYRRETYMESKKATKAAINKDIKKSVKKDVKDTYNLKSVNALTRQEFNQMMTAQGMGKKKGNKYLESVGGKELLEKIGSKNAESAYKGKFITGAMQGSGFADVITGSVGKNNKAAKQAIKQTKESKSYLGGYVAGQIGGFGLTQTGAAGKALAQGTIKAGAKAAAKSTGKGLGKQFAKNRAGEMIAEAPMNALDAVKMATDENGKVDKKALAGYMALNTGLTGAAGGALEGAAMKKASSNVKKLTELMGKQQAGTIKPKELEQLNKVRDAVRKSAQNVDSLSGEVSAKGLENVKASASEARINKAKVKSAAIAEERKTLQEVKNQNKAVEDIYNRTQSPTKQMTEISAERNKIARAQKDIDTINAAEAEAKNLPSREELTGKIKDANNRLDELKAQRANPNVSGASKTIDDSIAKVEKEIDELKRQENVVWSADRQQSRKATLQDTIKSANKNIEEMSVTKQTPNPKRVARDNAAREEVNRTSKALADAEDNLTKANDALRGALAHGDNSRKAHGEISPQTQAEIETARKVKAEAQAAYDAAKTASDEAHAKVNFAAFSDEYADEVGFSTRESTKGKNLTEGEVQAAELATMKEDLAALDDEIALTQRKLANATGDNAGVFRKELDQLRQQRMVIENAAEMHPAHDALKQASEALDKAVQTQKKGLRKLLNKANRAFVDSFGDWEAVFRSIDDPELRQACFDRLQKLRMSKAEASSKVFDEFLQIFDDLGLVGRKNSAKAADFERYTFLKHEVERIEQGTGFTGKELDEVLDEISTLQSKYADDFITVDGKKISQIEHYQQSMVKYFDDLLERDVKSGLTSAEEAKALREQYSNYVPTFRDVDGVDSIGKTKPGGEINFNRVHAAVGGDEWDVLPLTTQAFEKTQASLIRQNENELVSFVAEIAQVNKKDLVPGKTPKEYLESSTFTMKDHKTGKYSVAYFVNGEKKSLEISEGMYKGLRQWSGEDRAFFMNCKLVNTVTGKMNRWFKDWITDYSLIFGARNFIRDLETGLFYSSHPLRYARNIPRAVSCVMADTKMGKAIIDGKMSVPESMRNYLKEGQMLTNAYKKNGGRMSQLVSESDPAILLKRLQRKHGPLGVIREINSTIETIPRMAEFASAAEEAAMKKAKIPKDEWYKMGHSERLKWMNQAIDDPDTLANAMNRSKEITLNFDRSGYVGRWLNSTFVPFFNPAIQGADKLTRVLVRDNHTAAEWAKMIAMFGVLGQGSEVLLNTIYADNEAYKRLTDYEKTGYYHIPMSLFGGDEDSFLKIPRAREVAAVQGPLDWWFQHVKYKCAGKDENMFQSLKSNAEIWYQQIGPVSPISDNIFYTPVRIAKGETWYGGYIETLDDIEKVKAGKSDEVWDENTTAPARALNKLLMKGSDKLKFLGFSDAQIKNIKSHMWSPKKIDDLMDSYLGVIYDMGIKNTSMKNSSMTEAIGKFKAGSYGEGTLGLANIFGSSFGTAFAVDSVMSNSYRSNQYARKADLQAQLQKMTKGLEEGTPEYEKVIGSKEYMETNAKLRRLNQSFAYTSTTYDNLLANVYLNENLTQKQKNYWARQIKAQQNALLYGRQQGDKMANADPMKWAYNATRKDGSKLFTDDQVVDLCSFTFNDGNNVLKDAWKSYKKANPKANGKDFFEVTLGSREVNRVTGEALSSVQYNVNAYTIAAGQYKKGKSYDAVIAAFEPYGNDTLRNAVNDARRYYENGGNMGMYKYSHRDVVQGGIDLNVATYEMESWDMVNSLARGNRKNGKKHSDLAYYAEGKYVLRSMNAARCLASDKHKKENVDTMSVFKFTKKHGFTYKDGKDNYPKGEEVEAAIRKDYKGKSQEVMAAVYEEIMGKFGPNPFGAIGDYSNGDDTGISYGDGYGRRGRRRRGHGHGGWGGGGRGSADSVAGATNMKTKKVKDVTFDSNLDNAYRKKLKKLRDSSRKDLSKG